MLCQIEVPGEMMIIIKKRRGLVIPATAYRGAKDRQLTTDYPGSSPGGGKMHFTLFKS